MKFESLPNELLLELFEYFKTIDLLRTFFHINARFDALFVSHFQQFRLDFRSISKVDFDFVSQQCLSSIADRVITIHLSDDDETPHLSDHFRRFSFLLKRFTSLAVSTHCKKSIYFFGQHHT